MGCGCFKENEMNIDQKKDKSKIASVTNINTIEEKKEESPNVSK